MNKKILMVKNPERMRFGQQASGILKNRDGFIERGMLWVLFLVIITMLVACGGEDDKKLQTQEPDYSLYIKSSPGDQAVIQGQTAVFHVVAQGSTPLGYQWMRNGNDIPGAATSSYEAASLKTADDGAEFSVRVWDANSSVESNKAFLTVYSNDSLPPYAEYQVDTDDTDSSVNPDYGKHYAAFNTNVSSKNKLFVFFPGTAAKPNVYRLIVRAAANNGFYAVGLPYPNDETVYEICSDSGALSSCTNQVRQEILSGQGGPDIYDIDRADSIENRLQKLLLYLSEHHQEQGWDQFLGDDDGIVWEKIRLAGHSQGGAQAGYIGKQYAVDRVIFFSSPSDYDGFFNGNESWLSADGPTESERFYGFTNVDDNIILWSIVQPNWARLHMDDFGETVDIDTNQPPYNNSHMLTTQVEGNGLLPYHNVTVLDYSTPIDDNGLPVFLPVWQYLCFL